MEPARPLSRATPSGMFVDWNPRVSCEEYVGDGDAHEASH